MLHFNLPLNPLSAFTELHALLVHKSLKIIVYLVFYCSQQRPMIVMYVSLDAKVEAVTSFQRARVLERIVAALMHIVAAFSLERRLSKSS